MKKQVITTINYYSENNGYSHSETMEKEIIDFVGDVITTDSPEIKEIAEYYSYPNGEYFTDAPTSEDEYITLKIEIYPENADPMFDLVEYVLTSGN